MTGGSRFQGQNADSYHVSGAPGGRRSHLGLPVGAPCQLLLSRLAPVKVTAMTEVRREAVWSLLGCVRDSERTETLLAWTYFFAVPLLIPKSKKSTQKKTKTQVLQFLLSKHRIMSFN